MTLENWIEMSSCISPSLSLASSQDTYTLHINTCICCVSNRCLSYVHFLRWKIALFYVRVWLLMLQFACGDQHVLVSVHSVIVLSVYLYLSHSVLFPGWKSFLPTNSNSAYKHTAYTCIYVAKIKKKKNKRKFVGTMFLNHQFAEWTFPLIFAL